MNDTQTFPTVSLVLPIRNEAPFIEENLRKLLQQDYPADRMEIIVADGMSDDGTRDIVERMANASPGISLIDNPQRIVPTGLNQAIRQSQGEILIRVDGHVAVADDFVRQSVCALQEHPDAWAVGGPIVPSAHTPSGRAIAVAMSHPIGVGNAAHRKPGFEGYGEGTAFPAMHRWVFERVGYYDEALVRNQDDEFYFRITRAGGKFYITPKIQYVYYVRERFAQLFRQYYQYSFWRIPVMLKHQQPTTLRQVVPSAFYLTMLLAMVLGIVLKSWTIALALPTVYLMTLAAAGLAKISPLGPRVALRVPIAIATMHAGYAWGMVHGWLCHLFRANAWSSTNSRVARLSR